METVTKYEGETRGSARVEATLVTLDFHVVIIFVHMCLKRPRGQFSQWCKRP